MPENANTQQFLLKKGVSDSTAVKDSTANK